MTKTTAVSTANLDVESITRAIDHAVGRLQTQLESDELKLSIADLIRLIQLRNEIAGDLPVEITARWID